MAEPGLSGRPILVLFQSDDGLLTRLRAMVHLSPIVVPAAALAAGDYLARLIASQILQVFQNGDDAALTVSAASPPSEAPAGAPAQEEITRWLALSAGRVLAGAGRAVDLVLAGEPLARTVLETLEVAGGTSLDQPQGGAPVMRSTTSPLFFVRLAQPDPDLVVDAVDRLRRTDPDRLALRPY